MKVLLSLAEQWREDAGLLERYGAVEAAEAARKHARELVEAINAVENELLTQAEASEVSGYSQRRLREFEAEGKLENHGRRGAPRYRRGELPRKPQHDAGRFDAHDHARDILEGPR